MLYIISLPLYCIVFTSFVQLFFFFFFFFCQVQLHHTKRAKETHKINWKVHLTYILHLQTHKPRNEQPTTASVHTCTKKESSVV